MTSQESPKKKQVLCWMKDWKWKQRAVAKRNDKRSGNIEKRAFWNKNDWRLNVTLWFFCEDKNMNQKSELKYHEKKIWEIKWEKINFSLDLKK